jgi:2-oxoglutarate ferredoxin oxidoreductase subunit beta
MCKLAAAAGATFVAKGTAYHVLELIDLVEQALMHKGFSLVEVMTQCPTSYGRKNPGVGKTGVEMLKWLKSNSVKAKKLEGLNNENKPGKILRGVYLRKRKPEFCEEYEKVRAKAKSKREWK